VQAVLQNPNNAALPATVTASLTFNGSSTGTLTYSTSGLAAGDPFVIAALSSVPKFWPLESLK
jgi:hypothetical protein